MMTISHSDYHSSCPPSSKRRSPTPITLPPLLSPLILLLLIPLLPLQAPLTLHHPQLHNRVPRPVPPILVHIRVPSPSLPYPATAHFTPQPPRRALHDFQHTPPHIHAGSFLFGCFLLLQFSREPRPWCWAGALSLRLWEFGGGDGLGEFCLVAHCCCWL
jgi:hypothetical protein